MTDVLRELILPKLNAVKKSGSGFEARCPAHEDRQASLSLAEGTAQPVVLHCHAGCPPEDVCRALGLEWADLSRPRDTSSADGRWVATYDYLDEAGQLLFQVCRSREKAFLQRRPDPLARDGWNYRIGDTRRVLYRLSKVIKAVEECRIVYIVEGEKDVHTLEDHGEIATCNPGGAGKWRPEYTEVLRGAVVVIIADKDKPGQAHARAVREALQPVAASVTVAEAKAGKDATDHFSKGYGIGDLEITWDAGVETARPLAVELWDFLDGADSPPNWVVPGLLERGDRLILTGFEGLGKSMLVRQMAICAAAGLHPFEPSHTTNFDPAKVLFVDCENSESQGRRKLRSIALNTKAYNRPVPKGHMHLVHQPEGIDLGREDDVAWLLERVNAYKPDLLVIGSFYKLHDGNMNEEQTARRIVAVLDRARAISNCALITEAHAGHGESGKSRGVRPVGSSLLLRWPEFGFGIAPNALAEPDENDRCRHVDFIPWRGARDERNWPRHLTWGDQSQGYMPWQKWSPPKEKR